MTGVTNGSNVAVFRAFGCVSEPCSRQVVVAMRVFAVFDWLTPTIYYSVVVFCYAMWWAKEVQFVGVLDCKNAFCDEFQELLQYSALLSF